MMDKQGKVMMKRSKELIRLSSLYLTLPVDPLFGLLGFGVLEKDSP